MTRSAQVDAADRKSVPAESSWRLRPRLVLAGILSVALLLGVSSAFADDAQMSEAQSRLQLDRALEADGPQKVDLDPLDPQPAVGLPLEDLGRGEAEELLTTVFEPQIEGSAGVFGDLEVEKFLSDHVALVPGEDGQSALVESTLPLRTEESSGVESQVNLSLEHSEGALRPENALTEVEIPEQLGEGITLPEAEVTIELAGGPSDRAPSTVAESTAFYPNVAQDTDLTVSPTPGGVETLSQLRSAAAPTVQEFEVDLPAGATLVETSNGGAEVKQVGETIVSVDPPTAIDAAGEQVPVSLIVEGDTLVLHVATKDSTAFPVLVDPIYDYYQWTPANHASHSGWQPFNTTTGAWVTWMENPAQNRLGPTVVSGFGGTVVNGSQANWSYKVPRYDEELSHGKEPTSYIQKVTATDLELWMSGSVGSRLNSPYMLAGIWDPVRWEWAAVATRNGIEGQLTDLNHPYEFLSKNKSNETDTDAKWFQVGFASAENGANESRYVVDGAAMVELADTDYPEFEKSAGPTQWVNGSSTGAPITFEVSDIGLGVYETFVGEHTTGGELKYIGTRYKKNTEGHYDECTGGATHPCPRTWSSALGPQLSYDPSIMPEGEDWVTLTAIDPLNHNSAWKSGAYKPMEVRVKVDHTAPTLALSGSITEQANLGTALHSYSLKLNAADGTSAGPQSGVVRTVVKIDGKVEDEVAPGCTTKNCGIFREWTLDAEKYSAGQHAVEVIATDGVGLTTTRTFSVYLHPDHSVPNVALSGSMTEQTSLGTTRPRYALKVNATDPAEGSSSIVYASSFGSSGGGNGQFNGPRDIAIDPSGNKWVVDESNNRIQEFNPKGEFVAKFGPTVGFVGRGEGPGAETLSTLSSMAIDANGNLWLTKRKSGTVLELNTKGEVLRTFGSLSSGSGQMAYPEGIAIDANNNVWVADTGNNRLQEFNEKGEVLKVIGSQGTGTGQFKSPTGIDIGKGNVWVTDYLNNRIEEFNEAGEFVRQSGSIGTGIGQFKHPDSIAVDVKGNVWVGDLENNRIEKFGSSGQYLAQFGTKGSGSGQFNFTPPTGIAAESTDNLWITDSNNNRIQKWAITEASSSGIASSTIKVDGKVVDSTSPGCPAGGCSLTREWTLSSGSYSVGPHTVEASATDAAGLTTTKTLTINIARDTTAPQITANSDFFNAPEGWVEQQSYSYSAAAADANGYGNTSLALKVDGVTVNSRTQACGNGGCEEILSGTINTSSYSGGAHQAELVATDGAGNIARHKWTMNVDPEGHISTAEAEATFEALEETSPVNLIGEPQAEEYEGTAPGLGIAKVDGVFQATGTQVPTTIAGSPNEGVTMEVLEAGVFANSCEEEESESDQQSPDPMEPCISQESTEEYSGLEPIHVMPTATSDGADETYLASKVATITANTANHVDTIVRPLSDGAMNFEAIRDASASETFSWRVQLEPDQELKLISDQEAAAYYEGGHLALDFFAQPAHDAIGATVPTSLSVREDDILTLTVHHRSEPQPGRSFVYPVVAGTGWQGGFQTYTVEMPPPEPPPPLVPSPHPQSEPPYVIVGNVSAPESVSPQQAGVDEFDGATQAKISANPGPVRRHYAQVQCPAGSFIESDIGCGNPWQGGHPEYSWSAGIRATYLINNSTAVVWHKGTYEENIGCVQATEGPTYNPIQTECRWTNKKGEGSTGLIAAHGDWHIMWEDVNYDAGYAPMTEHVFGDGHRYTTATSCPGTC